MGIGYFYDDGYPRNKKNKPFFREYIEDGIITCPSDYHSVFGVLDGVSFYHPAIGPTLFDGLTQGQLAVRIISGAFLSARPGESVTKTLVTANNLIRRQARQYGLSLKRPELLPGAAFAMAQIGHVREREKNVISVVWGGDCGAVWQMKDGTTGGTINQGYKYEAWVEKTFAAIKKKHSGDLNCAWDEWLPIRRKKIRELQNKPGGWSTISGQPEFYNSWLGIRLPREDVSLIILFTDGFVKFRDTKDPAALSRKLVALYHKGGLAKILANTRASQQRGLANSHEATCPEATAIAIQL